MSGHVFVVQGNALQIACDELLLPTDGRKDVVEPWLEFGAPKTPRGWRNETARVTEAAIRGGRRVRWVNTGVPDDAEDPRGWLRAGVEKAFEAAAGGLRARADANLPNKDRKPKARRARPLIAAPIFGTGAGGFQKARGAVIKDLLAVSLDVVTRHDVDIVLIAYARSDYAALQAQRQNTKHFGLSPKLLREAANLGSQMARGEVAFFVGAGLSQAAGLPGWKDLIEELAQGSAKYRGRVEELKKLPAPDSAQLLSAEPGFKKRLRDALSTPLHAVGHSLIASMRPAEVITTNFDTLFEQAAQTPYEGALAVIPTVRGNSKKPWLLKLHGDIAAEHIVLNRDEFLGYDTLWRPLAGMLQSAMLTRHLVFVGYSLEDENFVRLGRSVSALLRSMGHTQPVGTVLTLDKKPSRNELWGKDIREISMIPDEGDSAWTFEVFLDRMAVVATAGESSYLLDEAYADLLSPRDRKLAAVLRGAGDSLPTTKTADPKWRALRDAFTSLGWQPPQ
ncbi:MAG: SIR2 family protein [Nakamurella sp.]